ncbi:terminal uridylyltransferase 4-like [Lycorma delicatula]|uniref:terminal uridylyltransferase 4-like n=1 Tax=Lycorma delicatula TaxID=130591 RepID=UPI003F514E99
MYSCNRNDDARINSVRNQEIEAVPKKIMNNNFSQDSENLEDDNPAMRMTDRNIRTQIDSLDEPRFEYIKRINFIQSLSGQRKIYLSDEIAECGLCRIFCNDYSSIKQHINNKNHLLKLEEYYSRRSAEEMPELPAVIRQKLCTTLEEVYHLHSIRSNNFQDRKDICAYINSMLFIKMQTCRVSLYGSSLHGLGLKDSEVNILINSVPSDLEGAFELVQSLIYSDKHNFRDVATTRSASNKIIKVKFIDRKTGLSCEIIPSTAMTAELSDLILKYTKIDDRACMIICLFRLWGKICRVDSPQYGTWPGFTLYLMAIHYLQQCDPPVLPVLEEELSEYFKEDRMEELDSSDVIELLLGKWEKLNFSNLDTLWTGIFKFYAYEFDERVVVINQKNVILRNDRGRSHNLYSVIDPFSPNRNFTRRVKNFKTVHYIQHCLKTTWKYFKIPQTLTGPVCGGVLSESFLPQQNYFLPYINCIVWTVNLIIATDKDLYSGVTAEEFRNKVCTDENYYLTVDQLKKSVGQDGHINVDCPNDKLPPLEPLPSFDNFTLEVLNRLCHKIYYMYQPTEVEIRRKYIIVENIENFLEKSCGVDVKLTLFGSSVNGFGFRRSDLDISLTFPKGNFGKEWLDKSNLIKKLYEHLQNYKEVKDLRPISTAKVPILKFVHRTTQLEGDISLYNEIAQVTSKLLLTYSKIDVRAPILGFMLKKFAKVCNIGSASTGSLSSFGYIIMVIYFLQRCNPPVLPVLQELDDGTAAVERRTFEGCDVYFFHEVDNLHKVWNGFRKNKKTAGQLWIEMLQFYTEEFDFVRNIISIQTSRLITKESKHLSSRNIAIEVPFSSSNNLGSTLSRGMNIYILRQFQGARRHFGRILTPPAPAEHKLEETFFDSYVPEGDVPSNDRGFRNCEYKEINLESSTNP